MIPILQFGIVTIPTYGLMFVIAALSAGVYIIVRTWRNHLPIEDAIYLYALTAIGAIAGAKLVYAIITFNDHKIASSLSELFGGSSVIGGIFGAGIGALLTCRFFGWSLRPFLPQVLPALPLALSIIRIGCLCEGCCYGKPFTHGIVFHESPVAPAGIPLIPTQIIDSASMFLLFLATHVLSTRMAPERLMVMLVYCCATIRFIGDWFRGDSVPTPVPALTMAQVTILSLVLIGTLMKRHIMELVHP